MRQTKSLHEALNERRFIGTFTWQSKDHILRLARIGPGNISSRKSACKWSCLHQYQYSDTRKRTQEVQCMLETWNILKATLPISWTPAISAKWLRSFSIVVERSITSPETIRNPKSLSKTHTAKKFLQNNVKSTSKDEKHIGHRVILIKCRSANETMRFSTWEFNPI